MYPSQSSYLGDLPPAKESTMSLDEVLAGQPLPAPRPKDVWPLPAVIVGTLTAIGNDGAPLVDFPGNRLGHPLLARSIGSVGCEAVGCPVALLFEEGDLTRPLIMGLIAPTGAAGESQDPLPLKVEATADGQRVTLTADKEIELRCGKASITLTQAGKVLIRGAYVLSRSSGINRIKGGAVQIN